MSSLSFPSLDNLGLHVAHVTLESEDKLCCPICGIGRLVIECYPPPVDCSGCLPAWSVYIDCDNCISCTSGTGETIEAAVRDAVAKWNANYPPILAEEVR